MCLRCVGDEWRMGSLFFRPGIGGQESPRTGEEVCRQPGCRIVGLTRWPNLMWSSTARIQSWYEYMNDLLVLQVFARTPRLATKFIIEDAAEWVVWPSRFGPLAHTHALIRNQALQQLALPLPSAVDGLSLLCRREGQTPAVETVVQQLLKAVIPATTSARHSAMPPEIGLALDVSETRVRPRHPCLTPHRPGLRRNKHLKPTRSTPPNAAPGAARGCRRRSRRALRPETRR